MWGRWLQNGGWVCAARQKGMRRFQATAVWLNRWLAGSICCGLGPWVPKCGADGFKTGSGYAPAMRQAMKSYAPTTGHEILDLVVYGGGALDHGALASFFGLEPTNAASFHIFSMFLYTF